MCIIYVIILILTSFVNIPYVDSYYYWLWSKNLQLSYFDGPPLIAYAIYLFTYIFSDSIFAINFLGVVIAFISSYIILQIVNLLVGKNKYNFLVSLLWLTSYTITTHRIINFVTYDGLVNLIELLTILYVLKFIHYRNNYYIYLIGIAIGFAFLAKYSAVILALITVCYFIYSYQLRYIFKQIHIYLAILISIIIFSPVLIWNLQHHFVSFLYQLSFHTYNTEPVANTKIAHMLYYIKTSVLGPAVYLFLTALFFIYIKYKNHTQILTNSIINKIALQYIYAVLFGIFLFWLFMSMSSSIPDRYLLLFHSLLITIIGIILIKQQYFKLLFIIILINGLWSIGNIITHSLIIKNPVCYTKYIQNGLLKSNLFLNKYMKIDKNASDFCWSEIRQS